MRKALNQRGSFDPLMIPLVFAILFLVGVSTFGIYSYSNWQDAQKVEQAEIDQAVKSAEARLTEDLEASFAKREKSPVRQYKSPASTGSVIIKYPKTWSVYSEESDSRGTVESWFHPGFVRAVKSDFAVATRMSVVNKRYDRELDSFAKRVDKGEVTVTSIKKSGVTGVRIDGNIVDEFQGSMVMFPIREKTLKIWTENNDFQGDYNDIILENLKFTP